MYACTYVHSIFVVFTGWDDSGKFVKLYISSLPGSDELTKDHVKVDFKEK